MDDASGLQDVSVPAALPRLPTWAGDLAAATAIVASAFVPFPEVSGHRTSLGYLAVVLPGLLVPLRHPYPRVMLGLCLAFFGLAAATFPITPLSALPSAVGVYTIAVRADRRTSLIVAMVVATITAPMAVAAEGSAFSPLVFQVLVLLGFATVAGEAVRVRRAYVAEITARAVRAEQTREAEASRRVAEDRLRIARDLHDAVAHQITVISLHAGVASSNIETKPDVARESLHTIREAARRVLGEIGDLLATLRSSDDREHVVLTPGLGHLASLLEEFESSGLDVTSRIEGDPARLSAATDVVAYRVIQEGLTNALRHGAGRAHVLISIGPATAELLITNPVGQRPDHERIGSGHGLVGIAERAASVRGHSSHSTDNGLFRLAVVLPMSDIPAPE